MRRYTNVSAIVLKNIVSVSPVVVGMAAGEFGFSFYQSGIYSCSPKSIYELDHAVTLIGYDANGNWLIKNSWGTDWGIKGFGWLSGQADCGITYWVYQVTERPIRASGLKMIAPLVFALLALASAL